MAEAIVALAIIFMTASIGIVVLLIWGRRKGSPAIQPPVPQSSARLAVKRVEWPETPEFQELAESQGLAELLEGLGIETASGTCQYLIPAGHIVPTKTSMVLSASDEGGSLPIEVCFLTGRSEAAAECRPLFRTHVARIPGPQDGCAEIELELRLHADGTVEPVARDAATGDAITLEVTCPTPESRLGSTI